MVPADADVDVDAALQMAVQCGHVEVVRWLIEECGCTPEGSSGLGLLHSAIAFERIDVLRVLLECGWDASALDDNDSGGGWPPILLAAAYGQIEAARVLLEDPRGTQELDRCDHTGWNALHFAASSGHLQLVRDFLKHGASVSVPVPGSNMTAAHLAAHEGYFDVLHELLAAGADPAAVDHKGWTPLHCVAQRGDLATFLLLHQQAVPKLSPASAAALLTAAVQGQSPEIVGLVLLSKATSPETCAAAGETPVHAAACAGFIAALCFLADAGFDLCARDEESRSPLHQVPTGYGHAKSNNASCAVQHDHFVGAAELLLEAGCKVDAADAHKCTPLHIAAGSGSHQILSRFIELTENVNATDEIGWTPLFWAASEGHGTTTTTTTCAYVHMCIYVSVDAMQY